MVVKGTSITGYLDGIEKIKVTDTTIGNGAIGFRSFSTSSLFDALVVTLYVPVSGVTLSASDVVLNTVTNNVYHLNATVTPIEANNKKVIWTTDNSNVATVDQTGNVTALSDGIATVTVTTLDGGYPVSANIIVDSLPPVTTENAKSEWQNPNG